MPFDLNKIDEYFPLDEFREGQREVIEYALNAFDSGKKFVILEAPTGAGKSVIGLTLARFFERSYYITIQKILQSQIMEDFGDTGYVVDLKGRANYPCTFYEREGPRLVKRLAMKQEQLDKILKQNPNCSEGYCRKRQKKFKCEQCFTKRTLKNGQKWGALKSLPAGTKYSMCPYYERLYECMSARVALFNFSSFLYQTIATKGRFEERDLLIVDECHNLEPELLSFIELSFNDKTLSNNGGYNLPNFDTPEEYWIHFQENDLKDKISRVIMMARDNEDLKLMDEYTSLLRKLITFEEAIDNGDEWVSEYKNYGDYASVTLKPVFVKNKTHSHIFSFGQKCLLMSATVLDVDVFCKSLGVKREHVAAYRMKNRFPKENRPIYVHSYTKVTGGQKNQKEWGPKILKAADEVIAKYPNEKGIIHTHNFSISRLLVSESRHRKRMLYQVNFRNKVEMLKQHTRSQNTIIVAPAMHEGLDLKNELSRFQIIAKVPFPNFFDDKQLARRVELDQKYYNWLVALKLVQSYGRSIRNEDDHADTYVIDEVFLRFIKENKKMLPGWFLDAIDLKHKLKK